jgi:hypothetical protein
MHQRIIVAVLCILASTACASATRALGAAGGCSPATAPEQSDVQTAINALGLSSAVGERLRSLVEAPLQPDSVRARACVVANDATCRAAGASAQRWRASDRYVVFQLGGTYWVRGTSWGAVNVLDGKLARIETFIDQ